MSDKILYFSDLHLDAVTCGKLRMGELVNALNFVLATAKQERVGAVVFGGDACDPDGPNTLRCISLLAQTASFLSASGFIHYWLVGNHDVCEDGFGTSTLSPLHIVGAAHVESAPRAARYSQDLTFGFLPHPSAMLPYDPAAEVAKWGGCDYIFGHLGIPGATPGSESAEMVRGKEHVWPAKAILKHQPNAICFGGHYHKGDTYWLDGLAINVVGSPARFTFGEEHNTPRIAIIEGKTIRYLAVPNATRLRTISIGAAISGSMVDEFVRVKYAASTPQAERDAYALKIAMQAQGTKFEVADGELEPPAAQVTAEDGFAIAEQLARDTATADAALNTAIVDLVKVLGEEACSS